MSNTKPNSSQITYDSGRNKQDLNNILDTVVPIADYTALRNYTGRATQVRITADGIAGFFRLVNIGDDNGGTIIRQGSTVDGNGVITQGTGSKRWERVFDGAVNVKWFGAKGDGSANDTAAFVAAVGTGNRAVFVPDGTFIVSTVELKTNTTLYGNGINSIIKSNGSVNHVISATFVYKVTIKDLQIRGAATNLCGLYFNGAVWTTLENLDIKYSGSHGIQFTDTGTANIGSYPVMVKGVHCRYNGGDGYRQIGNALENQQNAVYIMQCEMQGNTGDGFSLWGVNITVRDSISEGNKGYGIALNNKLTAIPAYSANAISIEGNYFEANVCGQIWIHVGTYGVIQGLSIRNNYLHANIRDYGIAYKAVSVTKDGVGFNTIRGLVFEGNLFLTNASEPTVYADFAGTPMNGSTIKHWTSPLSTSTADLTTIPNRYTGIGYATFKYIDSLTLNGFWFAKGGTGITYPNRTKSASITVSSSDTFFPVQVPLGSQLQYFSVPVETDWTSYTVRFNLMARGLDSIETQPIIAYMSGTGTGTQLVRTLLVTQSVDKSLVTVADAELIVQMVVQFTTATPGTYFHIGSPTLFYIAP